MALVHQLRKEVMALVLFDLDCCQELQLLGLVWILLFPFGKND
jgi:hypothetical protein